MSVVHARRMKGDAHGMRCHSGVAHARPALTTTLRAVSYLARVSLRAANCACTRSRLLPLDVRLAVRPIVAETSTPG